MESVMRKVSLSSIAALIAIGATLSVSGARAAVPTVDGPSVGRMHRVIIVDATPVRAVKPDNAAKRPANSEAQPATGSDSRAAEAPIQSSDARAGQPRARATAR
jgi:hypothetical protein